MCVIVSTYHETSITKYIQYPSKRVIRYINITKNRENYLQNTTKNLENDPMDLHMTYDFAILKLEIDKSIKTKKNLKILTNTQNPLKTFLINLT